MEHDLEFIDQANTGKKLQPAPDVRIARREVILQTLRDPGGLTDEEINHLLVELAELSHSLQQNPPEVHDGQS